MGAPVPLVEVYRSGRLESVHYGHVAVCDTQGKVLFARGDPQQPSYWRSSAKLLQAVTVVHCGAAESLRLTDAELAVICASHGAQALHVEAVTSILRKCGLTLDALLCGPHEPLHGPSAQALLQAGHTPQRIHNNCSGKHAGMLAACRHRGWPTDTYLSPDHPLQQANRRVVGSFAGVRFEDVPLGTDGCGVPTFYLSMAHLATAYARLANAKAAPTSYAGAAQRVTQAVCSHPVHIAWQGHFGTLLLEHLGTHVVAKGGAEGVFAAGLRGRDLGIALKIADGSSRAIPPVMVRLLEQFLHEVPMDGFRRAVLEPIRNTRGDTVGEYRVVNL
ncbi:MAG: L-asparaginase [Gemmataceae bacterium]